MKTDEKNQLPSLYEASRYESSIYQQWEESGFFNPDNLPKISRGRKRRVPFTIVMPPPNITGELHLGHASSIAYEDIMIRYKRLQGLLTLYVPGTDHAAIATQNKVEKIIAREGETRHTVGREQFLKRVEDYVHVTKTTIRTQIRGIGASCDWSREAYTLSDVASRVVNEVFTRMYNDGLIYRGNRIVNWCVRCGSTLADDEVEYRERKTPFYYLRYGPVVIATARPETKFLDKVIVVHPDDTRYKHLVGTEFPVPWIDGTVTARVIADPVVDPTLGTGAMTITPGHSFEDFGLAQKHGIEVVQIIGADGRLTNAAGTMAGTPAAEARIRVVERLREQGLVERIDEQYIHNLSVCYRCGTPVEPMPSQQWFVDVTKKIPGRGKSLKQLAHGLVDSGDIDVIPERFRKVYFHWIDNLRDWCISRQIWWGHRIPVWYRNDEQYVGATPPEGAGWTQDEDTLDTWFSSAAWTFSTLLSRDHKKYASFNEWIKKSPDLKRFHPTSVLETGYDILFFWVARMILVTSYVMKEKPFSTVYLHGMVVDRQGRKMSKSLGNGINPSEVSKKYGADALRLSLIIGAAPGADLRLYDEKIAGYRNFITKLWHIARFIVTSVEKVHTVGVRPRPKTSGEVWIMDRFERVAAEVTQHLESWRLSQAGEALYDFTWHDLADWYLEVAKIERKNGAADKKRIDELLLYILQSTIILWHPFAPFVTEVLWQQFHADHPLIIAAWPTARTRAKRVSRQGTEFQTVQAIINTIRRVRAEHKVPAGTFLRVAILLKRDLRPHTTLIETLARCRLEQEITHGELVRGAGFSLAVDLKLRQNDVEQKKLTEYIQKIEAKLSNQEFISKAPPQVIAAERAKLAEAKAKLGQGGS